MASAKANGKRIAMPDSLDSCLETAPKNFLSKGFLSFGHITLVASEVPMRISLLLLPFFILPAADWYVAPNGNDSNSGTIAEPLASFPEAVSRSSGGDTVRLQGGGVYRLTSAISVPAQVTVTSYGPSQRPILTASHSVTLAGTWDQNSHVRTAVLGKKVLASWIDGKFSPLARYPNAGWLQCDAGSSSSSIRDAAAAHGNGRWEGGQVRWRRWSWWWETRPISSDNGLGGLAIGGSLSVGDLGDEVGTSYCVDNVLAELDSQNEWYSDDSTFYVLPSPSTVSIEVATGNHGISAANVTFDHIAFARFAGVALQLNDAGSTVRDCAFSEIEDTAISVTWNAGSSQITGCSFTDVRNIGINWNANPGGATGGIIEKNSFSRIGLQPGYGGSGAWHVSGVVLTTARAVHVRLNRFSDIGYSGVIVGGDGQTVERNIFNRCLRTLNDGAAVYTNCSYTVIDRNIVLESIGDTQTGQPWFPLGEGIWPEFIGPPYHDTTITRNTVYGCNGHGIFLANHATSTVNENICLDNRLNGLLMSDVGGHTIDGNVLGILPVSRRATTDENLMNPAWVQPSRCISTEDGTDYGTMSGTTFIAPTGGWLRTSASGGGSPVDHSDVASWSIGRTAWADASANLQHRDAILLINDTEADTTMAPPGVGSWKLLTGAAAGTSVPVASFRSVVLVSDTPVTGVFPYYLKTSGGGGGGSVPGSRNVGTFPGPVSLGDDDDDDTGVGGGPAGAPASDDGGGAGGGCGAGGGIAALLFLCVLAGFSLRRRSDGVRSLISSQRGAFTLLELLVVMTVIALLVSLLLSAVMLIRDAARNTKCSSNQRSIAIAIQAYAADNKGRLPYRDGDSVWQQRASDYLESQYQAQAQTNRNDVFHCPFAVREVKSPWLHYYLFSNHYGMNLFIRSRWRTGIDWEWNGPPKHIASLPADLLLLTENKAWSSGTVFYFEDGVNYGGFGPWPVRLEGSSATVAPIVWHTKSINFVCIDGHLERVKNVWDEQVMKFRFDPSL